MILSYIQKNKIPLIASALIVILTFGLIFSLYLQRSITISLQEIPLRNDAGAQYQQTGSLKQGQKVQIIEEKNGWYHIQTKDNGEEGWIASWLATAKKLPDNRKIPQKIDESTIVLDAGHGGNDSGSLHIQNTTDPTQMEKTYTLSTVKALQANLQANTAARVILTRDSDKLVLLANIPVPAEENHADAFVSIHFDSSDKENSASGFTTYYYHDDDGSKQLGEQINQQLDGIALQNRGNEFGDYLVIRENTRPAVLLELGYMNSDKDFDLIKSNNYQQDVANRIRLGLNIYLNNDIQDAK